MLGELRIVDGDGSGIGEPSAEMMGEGGVVVGDGLGEGAVMRGVAEESVSGVEGNCFGEHGRGEGAEADRQEVVDVCDEGGSGPVVWGGGEFGDLFVEGGDVAGKGVDLGDEREGGDGVDVVKDDGEGVSNRLFSDVGSAGQVLVDGGVPRESVPLGTDDETSVFAMEGDLELFPKGGGLSQEVAEVADVGGPEGDNVGFPRLEVEVGGEGDFLEDKGETRRKREEVVEEERNVIGEGAESGWRWEGEDNVAENGVGNHDVNRRG